MAAPLSFSFSVRLHKAVKLCVFFLFLSASPLSLHALDVSSACPHLLTASTLHNFTRPPSNDSLLVVVPWKVGFEQFVHFNPDSCFIDGFSVQVFLHALRHMQPQGPQLPYQFVLYGDGNQMPSYKHMIDMVVNEEVDAVVADLTITKERMDIVDFTMPYLASSLVMVTPFRYGSAGTLWDFLRPFSAPLWLTLLASFVATGVALYLLENKNPDFSSAAPKKLSAPTSPDPSSHGSRSPARSASAPTAAFAVSAPTAPYAQTTDTCVPSSDPLSLRCPTPPIYDEVSHKRRILNAYWFTSLCVFQAQQESVRTHLGRFVAVMWLFVALIFNSSYTASLASLLSAQKMYPTIGSFEALLSDKNISVGYQAGSFMEDYMRQIHFDQNRLKEFSSEMNYTRALRDGNLKPDGVGAVLDELPYIQILLQSECFLTKGPADDALPSWGGFGFAFRKNSPLIEKFSKMIVAMQEDETITRLQKGWGIGEATSDRCSSTEEPSHLRLRSFGGLFSVLCGAYVFCIALHFLRKRIQSDGGICTNIVACTRGGCNTCKGRSLSRRSSRVGDVSLERSDASLVEHSQGN